MRTFPSDKNLNLDLLMDTTAMDPQEIKLYHVESIFDNLFEND